MADYSREENLRSLATLEPAWKARGDAYDRTSVNIAELQSEIDRQGDPSVRAVLVNEYRRLTGQDYSRDEAPLPPGRRLSLADFQPRYTPADDAAEASPPAAERSIRRSKEYMAIVQANQPAPPPPPKPSAFSEMAESASRVAGQAADAVIGWATKDRPAAAPGQVGAVGAAGTTRYMQTVEPTPEPTPENTYRSAGPSGALRDIRENTAARTARIAPPPASVLQNPDGSGMQVPDQPGGFTQQEMSEGSIAPWKADEQRRMGGYVAPTRPAEAKPFGVGENIAQDLRESTRNPLARGAASAFSNLAQTGTGLVRLTGDLFGLDSVRDFAAGAEKIASTVEKGATSDLKGNDKLAADVMASIGVSAPSVALGYVGGPALRTLFVQSALSEYGNGRDAGFGVGESAARAGIYGTAEALGERFGFGEQIRLLKSVTRGLPQSELAKVLGSMIAKEVPGEQLTTAMQFLADKIGPAALNPNASVADYLNAAGETLKVTIAQTAVMGGGPAAINTGRNELAAADRAIERSAMSQAERAAKDAGFLRPTERRKQAFERFDDLRAQYGLLDPIWDQAAEAVKAETATMRLDQVPGYLRRFSAALSRRIGRPLDDAALSMLDDPHAPPAVPPRAVQSQPGPTIADRLGDRFGLTDSPTDSAAVPHGTASARQDTGPVPASEVLGTPLDEQAPAPAPATSAEHAGEPINRNWTAFAPESGSLNIPREQLPQIQAEHRGALVNFLAARGIAHESAEVPADSLKPTQGEFSPRKVQQAREYQGGDRSILVSSDGYVLDGHHQWLAKLDNGEPVKVIRLDAPIQDLLRLAHQFPSSTTAPGPRRTVAEQQAAGAPEAFPVANGVPSAGSGTAPVAPAPSATPRVIARAGRTPSAAQPIELRPNADGTLTPYMGGKAMLDYDSGNPITMPAGVSDLDAKKAIRAAGAVSNKVNFFAPTGAEKTTAQPEQVAAPPAAEAPAQSPAPEVKKPDRAARAKARMALDPTKDSMLEALAKLGGIRRDVVAREFGLKPEELKHTVATGGLKGFPFRKTGGMDLDAAMTALREAGYFMGVADEDVRGKFEEAIFNELGGGRELTPQGIVRAAQDAAETEDPFAPGNTIDALNDFTPDELEESGYADASPEVKAATQMLLDEAEAAGIDTDALREDAARQTEGQSADVYHARLQESARQALATHRTSVGSADTAAARGSVEDHQQASGDQGQEGRPDIALTAPNKAQVLAQQAAIEKEQADREAPADQPRDQRTADQVDLFNTQGSVFDQQAEAPATETPAAAEPKPAARPEELIALRKRASVLKSLIECTAAGSLTTCLRKAGNLIHTDDKAAILKRAKALREEGSKAQEAAVKAVQEQMDAVRALLVDAGDAVAAAESEAPVAAPANPAANAAPQSQPTERLTDAGEELIRNRRGKLKGLAWDDVSAMNDTLKVAQVVKSNVWPRPDYAKMVEDGAPAWKVAALKAVYDKLAAAPVTRTTPTDADLRAYIETMQAVREALTAELDRVAALPDGAELWKSLKSENVFGKVFPLPADARTVYGRPSPFDRSSEQGKENNRRALLIGGNNAVQSLQFGYKTLGKINDLLADGFPAKQEAWQKSWEVRSTETRNNDIPEAERTGQPQQRFYVYEKGSRWRLAKGVQDGGYATREQAEAFARSLTQKKREQLPPSRGLDLADARRTGPDWRGGKNVTAKDILDKFGFKGVNLGEYVKAKQTIAQSHLNHVFDAMSDLADLLGVPPKAMSLNGTLGVAIGAQGSGKALAHFVPGVNEINITRDSGAGALAHEFGHALDHYFAAQHGKAVSMAKRPYLSAAIEGMSDPGGVRPEVIEAMRHVMRTINTRPMTEAEAKKYMADQRELNQRRLDRWIKEFKGNRGADAAALDAVAEKLKRGDIGDVREGDLETNLAELVRAAGLKPGNIIAANAITTAYRLRDLADESRFLARHIPQQPTDYAKASDAMDAKKQGDGYWSTPWEKFARAFETFAIDALHDRERESLYLTGMVDSEAWRSWAAETGKTIPYPAGEERLAMQQAFQKLVDTIETEETDQGVRLHDLSRVGERIMRMGYERQDTERIQAARKLAGFIKRLDEGKMTEAEFELAVRMLAQRMDAVVTTKAANRLMSERERGADYVRERLLRARRQGDLDPDAVEFALWALDQNPALATNLAISVRTGQTGAAGDYNPAAEIVRLFKGSDNPDTAVHELLHHAERMMPKEMQTAVREEWARALMRAVKSATPEQRAALEKIGDVLAGDRDAYKTLTTAIQEGPLNYADHYQLVNPSEFWAVNASRILGARHASSDSVWGRIRNWLRELGQKIKGILGLPSDAPLLRALDHIIDPTKNTGERQSTEMLSDKRAVAAMGDVLSDPASPEAHALRAISENDEMFALPKSTADTIEGITFDNDPTINVRETKLHDNETMWTLTMPDGRQARITMRKPNPYGPSTYSADFNGASYDWNTERPGDNPEAVDQDAEDVWIDVSQLKGKGDGAMVYNIAANFAHNTGRIFIGDPNGVSADAMRRRPVHMLSSALKFGTTRHLAPHPDQVRGSKKDGIPPLQWVYGDDLGNIRRLIDLNITLLENDAPTSKNLDFDVSTGSFVNVASGRRVSSDAVGRSVTRARSMGGEGLPTSLAGRATVERVAILRALLREEGRGVEGEDGRRDGLLARLVRLSAVHPDATRGVFYDRSRRDADAIRSGDASAQRARGERLRETGIPDQETARYTADPDRNHLRIVDFAREQVAQRKPGFLLRAVVPSGNRPDLRAAAAVARGVAGHKIIFVRQDGERVFNGVAFGSVGHNYILLDVDSTRPVMAVVGHEILHRLRAARPDLYAKLNDRLSAVIKNESAYAKKLRDRYSELGLDQLSDDKIHEELLADIFGDEWNDPEFWRELGKDKPTGFKAVVDSVAKFLDDLVSKIIKLRPFGTEQYLSDLKAARAAVLEATREFQAGEVGETGVPPSGMNMSVTDPNGGDGAPPAKTLDRSAPANLRPSSAPLDRALSVPGSLVARLTSPTYDWLLKTLDNAGRELFGRPYLYAKAGLAADYGLGPDYKQARSDMQTGIRKGTREAATVIEQLATLTREESRIAHLWMQEKPDTATEQALMAAMPESSRETLRQLKDRIDQMGRDAVALGLLSAETYERNAMAYLHRSYRKYELDDPAQSAVRSRSVRILGDQYKGRGLRDDAGSAKIATPDWWRTRQEAGKADTSLKGEKFYRLEKRRLSDAETPDMFGGSDGRLGRLESVLYWPANTPIPPHLADWRNDGVWEARFFDKPGKVGMWRDFTLGERTAMGEIQEVRYSAAKTMLQATRDLETARLLDWVARNRSVLTEEQIPEGAELVKASEWLTRSYIDTEWVQVPAASIPGTDGVKRYGNLAGRYIPGPIWNDLRQMVSLSDQGDLMQVFDKMLRAWKINKTALSPATHINNVLSNFILADAHDIQARHIARAMRAWLYHKDRPVLRVKADPEMVKLVEDYQDNGGDGGKFNEGELREDVMQELLNQLEADVNGQDTATALLSASQVLDLIRHREFRQAFAAIGATKTAGQMVAPAKALIKIYGREDELFRLAAFIKARDDGLSDHDAGQFARTSFLDYNINAPWIAALRRTAFPFAAFTYRAVPMLLRVAADKPHKLYKYMQVAGALNAFGYLMTHGVAAGVGSMLASLSLGLAGGSDDEDRERALLPDEKAGRIWGIFPKLVRMPWNDEHGSPVFLDVRRWIPAGDVIDTNSNHSAVPVPAPLVPGGPLVILAEILLNRQSFTGQNITKDTDTLAEKWGKFGDYLWKSAAPNFPGLPGSYSTESLANAATGKTDAFGREQSVGQAALSAVGVKVASYPRDVQERNLRLESVRSINEIKAGMRADARQLERKGISQEEHDRRQARAREKIRQIADRRNAKLGQAQGATAAP